MRHWIPALMLIPVTGLSHAADKRCLISFDSATLNVCTSEVQVVSEVLRPLADVAAFADAPVRIVKFDGPIRAQQRAELESNGIEIIGYAPYHAYLVRMNPIVDPMVRAIRGVLWTGPYLPIWKVDGNLARDVQNDATNRKSPSIIDGADIKRLTVALHPNADINSVRTSLLSVPGIEVLFTEKGADHERIVVSFERDSLTDAVRALARQPEVSSVGLRWSNQFMNSQAGWLHQSGSSDSLPIFERGIFGCGQIVGAADSGLFASHCSFSDTAFGQPVISVCADGSNCLPVAPNFGHRKIGAHYKWDGSTSGLPADGQGHGTHVIGSLTGNNPASAVDCTNLTSPGGLTDLDGTAPGAKLISQEMGASLQYVNDLGGTIYHASTTAYQNGARIHSNSWGSSCRSGFGACIAGCEVEYRDTSRDADRAVWDFPQLAIFVAAGNSGGLGGSAGCGPGADIGSGGNAKNVFSIGSNDRGTAGNAMSGFSSRGPTQDRRSKPDLTAQGSSIVSAQRDACGTRVSSGTSMATPTAAGLATLAREYLNRGFYPSGIENPAHAVATPSAALLKALLINGAQEITGAGTTGGAPSQSQGWGRVHLDNALYFDGDARSLWLHDGTSGLQTDGAEAHQIVAEAGEPLIITLAWHDFPALVNANPHTVNRLRLEVESPEGDVWTQKLSPAGGLTDPNPFQGTSTADYDDANNVHQIRFDAPTTGPYQIRVRGIEVAQGPQPYALAATGKLLGLTDPDFLLQTSPSSRSFCAGADVTFNVGVFSFENFNDPVTLAAPTLPGGATSNYSVNPVTPTAPATVSVLSIANTANIAGGTHTVTIAGTSSGANFPVVNKSRNVTLLVDASAPTAGSLLLPVDDATQQSLRPTFSWAPFGGAASYRLEVATDAAFANVIIDQVVPGTSFVAPASLTGDTEHFWRVTGSNQCGSGAVSAVFSFTTSDLICSEPDLAIPDNNAAGISDVITVNEAGLIGDLRLALDVTHTYIGDLQVTLTKGSTVVQMVSRPTGCSGNDINVTIDDAAALSMQSNCASGGNPAPAYINGESYRPAQPLAGFDGVDFSGAWTLNVSDRAGADIGKLNRWCLLPTTTPQVKIFSNGFEASAP